MPAPQNLEVAPDRRSEQGEIADGVERLVADRLVREAEVRVHRAVFVEDDAVVDRPAQTQSGPLHLLDVHLPAEGPRRRQAALEAARVDIDLQPLASHGAAFEVDRVVQAQAGVGRCTQPLVAAVDLDHRSDREDPPVRVLGPHSRRLQQQQVGHRRAVEDRHLGAVHLDDQVVDAEDVDSGEEVLDSRDGDVVATERGGEFEGADAREVGGNLHVAGIRAAETDARIGRRRQDAQIRLPAGVNAHAGDRRRTPDRLLAEQAVARVVGPSPGTPARSVGALCHRPSVSARIVPARRRPCVSCKFLVFQSFTSVTTVGRRAGMWRFRHTSVALRPHRGCLRRGVPGE